MNQKKKLAASKVSMIRVKSYKKTVSNLDSMTTKSNNSVLGQRMSEQKQKVLRKVNEAWHMVSAMGMQNIKQSILKYLKKLMQQKAYQQREIIMELLRNGCYPREEKPNKEYSIGVLLAEIENLKEELESYLLRRFTRDIQIIQERINHSDGLIKELIDLQTYQKLICSFRPALISNPTDIPRQFQDISRTTATSVTYFNHIQQLRYNKLAGIQKEICQSHAQRCREKLQTKLLVEL